VLLGRHCVQRKAWRNSIPRRAARIDSPREVVTVRASGAPADGDERQALSGRAPRRAWFDTSAWRSRVA
jgi:hypothetical protein